MSKSRPASTKAELLKQKRSNRGSLPYFETFKSHRERLTRWALHPTLDLSTGGEQLEHSPQERSGRICVLGAGNCYDLDLEEVAARYEEVHLVDLDADALKHARLRQPKALRNRIQLHAPVDVSGCNKQLALYKQMRTTEQELAALPNTASQTLLERLGGPFDRVVSACIMSQLLLTVRRVLGTEHPLFHAVSVTLLVAHLRTLLRLSKPGSAALWASDVTSSELVPKEQLAADDAAALLKDLIAGNRVFNYLDPGFVAALAQEDPVIAAGASWSGPLDVWQWDNGPHRRFLVYAAALRIKS